MSNKSLDPWEDDSLMTFIKTGKHIPGISKKQVIRVEHLSRKYCFSDNILLYKCQNEFDNEIIFKKVPKIEDREDIVRRAHYLGHFAIEKTINLLKIKYFWPHLFKDVEFVINNCIACLKYKKFRPKEHPAMSLPILGVNDRLSIDQVHGLPLTIRGNNGIDFLTEHVTGYASGYPIKGKTAEESGIHLWDHITRFGPPKELLSDMGKEFVNGVVKSLTTMVGTDHVVTSAYHPNTNGLTERGNSTLCEALRVFCSLDENTEDWDLKLPYIIMAYNLMSNSSRKFSPHELMFGTKMNFFEDFCTETKELEIPMILKRAAQIRILNDETLPKAIENLQNAQIQQRKSQNKAHNIQIETLEVGSKVMLWDPTIKGKLNTRKSGPYLVSKISARNNYFLTNCHTNVALKNAIPLRRLEQVSDSVTEIDETEITNYDISKIKSIRGKDKDIEFLVEWKDKPKNKNTWVFERDLDKCPDKDNTINLIKNFKSVLTSRMRTRQSSRILAMNFLSLLGLCLIFLPLLMANTIEGDFKVCSFSKTSKSLNFDNDCQMIGIKQDFSSKNFTILEKRLKMIEGKAHVCWAEKITRRSWRNYFLFQDEERLPPQRILLSSKDCWEIINLKLFLNQALICNNNLECSSYIEPVVTSYPHLGSNYFDGYNIRSSIIHISSDSLDKPIFDKSQTSCLPEEYFCVHGDSSYVWDKSIIHKCEYYKVKTITMMGNSHIYFSNNSLIQIDKIFNACGIKILSSSEGLYLTEDIIAKNFSTTNEDINLEHHLMISDFDKKLLDIFDFMTKSQRTTNLKFCVNQKSDLKSLENRQNEFAIVNDFNGLDVVVFSKNLELIICDCYNISTIKLNNDLIECFSQIPIMVRHEQKFFKAFLNDFNIIGAFAENRPCTDTILLKLPGNIMLNYTNKITNIIKSNRKQQILHQIDQSKITINFDHNRDMTLEIDPLKSEMRIEPDTDQLYFIAPIINFNNSSVGFVESITSALAKIKWNPFTWDFFKDLSELIKNIIIGIVSIISIIILCFLTYLSFKMGIMIHRKLKRKNKKKLRKRNEEVGIEQMELLPKSSTHSNKLTQLRRRSSVSTKHFIENEKLDIDDTEINKKDSKKSNYFFDSQKFRNSTDKY